jgi:hypothetical protein
MYRVRYVGLYRLFSLDILHPTFIAMMGKIDHYLMSNSRVCLLTLQVSNIYVYVC